MLAPPSSIAHSPAVPPVNDAAQNDLLVRLEQAEQALRARDDFLAMAAHELRSPLHALGLRMAALERLAAQSGHAQLQAELQRARRSVDRYVRRAVTLLDLSRVHAGVLLPRPSLVRAADVVRTVVDDYRDEARFHGATLDADVPEDLFGWWDAHMLEQVLANLVSNAIKYGQGTPVLVRGRQSGTADAVFEVCDRGPGIDEAHRAKIFEKFERAVARDSAGFGLGLWIVGRMVAAHRGTIAVTGRPGGGALFRVTLPLQVPGGAHQDPET
jgi:signal transduction histidine kinase